MEKQPRNLVVSGLVKRRRDIQARADYLTRELVTLQADVATLDKAILLICPDYDLGTIKPQRYTDPNRILVPYQAEVTQFISNPEKPLTVAEICDKLIEGGHPCNSAQDRAKLRDKIKNYLNRKVKRGWVVKKGSRYRLCDSLIETGLIQE